MDNAFAYLKDYKFELETAYPYVGKGGSCMYDESKGQGILGAFNDVTINSPEALQTAASMQPISVALEADKAVF